MVRDAGVLAVALGVLVSACGGPTAPQEPAIDPHSAALETSCLQRDDADACEGFAATLYMSRDYDATPDGKACQYKERACILKPKHCREVDRACGVSSSEEDRLLQDRLAAACQGGLARACETLLVLHRRAFFRDEPARARAIEVVCNVSPVTVCTLLSSPDDEDPVEDQPALAEEVMACAHPDAQRCAIAVAGADGGEMGPRMAAHFTERCRKGEEVACRRAFEHHDLRSPEGRALLDAGCKAGVDDVCRRRWAWCGQRADDCDVQALLRDTPGHCRSSTCNETAADTLLKVDRDAAREAMVRACAAGGFTACQRGANLWRDREGVVEAFERRCGVDDACARHAASWFLHAFKPQRALAFLAPACKRGDDRACDSLPYVQLEVSKAERTAEKTLDGRCSGGDARACWALAKHFDKAWPPQVPRSKTYAKRACDHGEKRGCRFKPNPLSVPAPASASPGIVGGIIDALTAPVRAIP